MEEVSTAKIVLFHQGSTELRRCENCVFFLPVNILTGVTRRLLGPHDTLPCVLITQSIYKGCIYWLYALADFAYKCTYLLQDKNDKDVVSVRHVQRQTVESVVIALIKRNLVERRDLNNVVFIESVGKFTSGKTNFQKA